MTDERQEYYKVQEISLMFQVSTQTVYSWIRRGLINAVRIDGVYRVPIRDIEELAKKREAKEENRNYHPLSECVGDARLVVEKPKDNHTGCVTCMHSCARVPPETGTLVCCIDPQWRVVSCFHWCFRWAKDVAKS